MIRFMAAPTVKRALVVAIVTGIVTGCSVAGQTAPSPTSQGQPPQPTDSPGRTPSPSVWTGLASGPIVITGTDAPVQVAVNIASPGWEHHSGHGVDYLNKNDDGLDPPESVAATLLAWAFPAGAEFKVYGDSCRSSANVTSATTPDDIAAALAAIASSDASAPVDVTVDGFAGKAITIHGPLTAEPPDASPQGTLGDCEVRFAVGLATDDFEWPFGGAGGIDELAILNVDGSIVILDAVYTEATPADLVEEMRTLVESATFELP